MDSPVSLKIPPGTQTGKLFRLKEKGVSHLKGDGRGDQLVMVHVVTPQSLDERQRKVFEELAKTLGEASLPKEDRGFFRRIKDVFEA